MEEFLNHFDDPEWKSYVFWMCSHDVRDKKITTVAALYSDLSGKERRMDAQSTEPRIHRLPRLGAPLQIKLLLGRRPESPSGPKI
jgi:hypothetical protein